MKTTQRLSLVLLSLLLSLSLSGCSSTDNKTIQKDFDKFINEEFVNEMEDSYTNSHILLEQPENFSVDTSKAEIVIDNDVSQEVFDDYYENASKSVKKLEEFDRDKLTDSQKDIYDIYKYKLNNNIDKYDSKYSYMSMPLESMSGMHTQLPILFADWELRNEQDVQDIITVMKSVPNYMNSIIEYTKQQEEKGTLMIDIDNVKEYCQKVVDEDINSSVLTGLYESIDSLNLGDEKTQQYKDELKITFQEYFIPSYNNMIKTMNELDTSKNNELGLSHLKNGKNYYEVLFKEAIGTDKSIKEIKKELNDKAKSALLKSQGLLMSDEQLYNDYINENIKTNYTDFETMLSDLNESYTDDFPSVDELQYNIKPIAEDLASGGIAAYFNIPPLDNSAPNKIRVNMLKDALDIQSLDTFSTLAHEGIPGHMYQISYAYQNLDAPLLKSTDGYLGYTEGYATYVELYSLKYLEDVSSKAVEIYQNMKVYQNCIVALSDIGINYEGWTKEETANFMQTHLLEMTSIDEYYNQIRCNPTAFLSYYVGYLQHANLKEEAEDTLKSKFDDKEFHEAILKSGPAPFSVVEKNVNEYIEDNK